jgi:hypothetical protein
MIVARGPHGPTLDSSPAREGGETRTSSPLVDISSVARVADGDRLCSYRTLLCNVIRQTNL